MARLGQDGGAWLTRPRWRARPGTDALPDHYCYKPAWAGVGSVFDMPYRDFRLSFPTWFANRRTNFLEEPTIRGFFCASSTSVLPTVTLLQATVQ